MDVIAMTRSSSKRFRDYGFITGVLPCGSRNLITDVGGVKVGHFTKIQGDDIRTGITLIDPGVKNIFKSKIPAAYAVGNGFGKLTGTTQMEELGTLEAPIALTNTLAVGPVMRGVVDLVLDQNSAIPAHATINAVVGETNDGLLNSIHKDVLSASDVQTAYKAQTSNPVLGAIGAGTGTRAFSWKGGIGSASRIVNLEGTEYTLGALVQTNFGGSLSILGVPIGQLLNNHELPGGSSPDGSCMIVVATDAPLSARQLKRVAKRALLGMIRTGSIMAHGSGDYAVAFSTARQGLESTAGKGVGDEALNPIFLAAVEAAEEGIYDALFAAETTFGRAGNKLEALPKEKVVKLLEKYL